MGRWRGQQTQMARQGATETDKRVKGLHQCDRVGGWEGLRRRRRRRRRRRGRKMSAVAFVAPSGDVMFATSLQLSGHPSSLPPPPPRIQRCPSLHLFISLHTPPPPQLSRQQSPIFFYQPWLHSACHVTQLTLHTQGVSESPKKFECRCTQQTVFL